MGGIPLGDGGVCHSWVPKLLLGDDVGAHGLEPSASAGDPAGNASPVVGEEGERRVAEWGGRLVLGVWEGEDEGGGRREEGIWRRRAGSGPWDG